MKPAGLLRRGLALVPPLVLALAVGVGSGHVVAGALSGALGWALLRWVIVTRVVAPDFQRGRSAVAAEQWAEGEAAFAAAQVRWEAAPGLDRWRSLLLGSTGRWPFAAMARYNRAVCLFHLGRTGEALDVIEALLAQAPGMKEARQLRDHLAAISAAGPSPDR
ncbi:MAG: hypothetical protein H6742_09285 [Alphaproteobacteria bacterium]|nr:hypothetical protein [Alphaproteobacteria bacterium]